MSTAADRGYLSIGEVLSLLQDDFPDVTISKIRFLESQGLIDPERTPSGYRKFYADDVKRLRFILHEQRANFLPLRVIRDRLGNPVEVTAAGESEVLAVAAAGAPVPPVVPAVDRTAPAEGPTPAAHATAATTQLAVTQAAVTGQTVVTSPAITGLAVTSPGPMSADAPTGPAVALSTGVSLTADELVRATGLSSAHLRELESFGLIIGRVVGRTHVYDEEGLAIAKLAAGFIRHGIEPRHLRMYKTGVEREASLFEQAVLPMLKQRNPTARAQALDTLRTLVDHGEGLRVLLARRVLHAYQSPSTGSGADR